MHVSVLLKESIDSLNIKEDGIYVDCTLGYAGHSSEILKRVKKGRLVAFDQDQEAITASTKKLEAIGNNFTIIKSNFVNLKEKLEELGITEVDGILFDLGVSSPQLDEQERGFSYHQDAKLDMRMDRDNNFSAYDVVNTYDEKELSRILFQFGEEKYANSIARNIVKARNIKPIDTTFELVDIIKNSMPEKAKRDKHPARKTFQAIRIEVNHELDILEKSMRDAASMLKVGGLLSVITFHSLEDRIVKNVFKDLTEVNPVVKGMPNIPLEYLPDYELVNHKAITPSDTELEENNRSRSSKLRVIKRIK
ncbi:MAG: 16S rRNA (cytosine(1402)-N(4))-methyltransferase RsmH [Tenericutes bacterium]|nr:16S rRNA (cytosine(1402)-N(4))-methyltransferase RsmH [Mycoplasmatota bacterium]